MVAVGGATAALGALLALIAGIGRTTLAMAREGDLPRWLAAVHPRFRVPHRAEVVLAVVVSTLVATLPWQAVAVGTGVIVLGIAYRGLRLTAARPRPRTR